jgi:hypothetical protein
MKRTWRIFSLALVILIAAGIPGIILARQNDSRDTGSAGNAFFIAQSQGSTAPPRPATTKSITLSPEQEIELKKLMRWQHEILTYYDSIVSFVNSFNQAMALKNASGFGSLLQAQPRIDEMKKIMAQVQAMVPDDQMRAGHIKLLSAFNLMIQCLVLNPTPKSFYVQSQNDLAMAQAELAKWKAQYDAAEDRFIRSTKAE